ncbi:MAG: 16S rRNA (cytosine(967)-C(5))-methyltransferase RsmB [Oxalobacter formigenes]|nr:16S rRNA (cytosine(967)-C(5))-methyltransferase RsmB [Oxalobacter formigenes]
MPPDSLALSLAGAAYAVAGVANGMALPATLSRVFHAWSPSSQAAGAMQDIAYRTMRQFGLARRLLRLMVKKTPDQPLLHSLLCCALALLSSPGENRALPYEPHTVVDQSVRTAAALPSLSHAKGMVNAVLRRFTREQASLLPEAVKSAEAAWNYPAWWIRAVQSAYPRQWETLLENGNTTPPLTLRVNRKKLSAKDYLARLKEAGIGARQVGPAAVILGKALPVSYIPGFAEGLVSVQDAAAQQAASLLDMQNGMRVLDACAAPGGKTGHILETADVRLLALDHDPARLERIRENMVRLGLQADIRQGSASTQNWWDGIPFDRILADVPCTASGIVRRHPDIRWLRRKTDTSQLATLSAQILDNLWQMLRPDGKLLFVTCSIWPEESEKQAAAFAARNHAARLPAPGQLLPATEQESNHDGLFYALFQKPSAS